MHHIKLDNEHVLFFWFCFVVKKKKKDDCKEIEKSDLKKATLLYSFRKESI